MTIGGPDVLANIMVVIILWYRNVSNQCKNYQISACNLHGVI